MSPVNHLLSGWLVASTAPQLAMRDRLAITLACLLPDLDGLGIFASIATRDSANPITWWSDFHHVLAHNLLFGLLLSLAVYFLCRRRPLAAALSLISFHLHLIEDLLSGRQGDGEIWSIQYLYPFSASEWFWNGQWELNAWPNFVVVVLLLTATFALAWRRGYSPLGMVSTRADAAFVATLRHRFGDPAH